MAMNNYTIESPGNRGGDKTEKAAWPLFAKEKFPNYELLWQRFVAPRTNRPTDIHFAAGTPPTDREIAGIHYSILHSFYVVYDWLSKEQADPATEKQSFEIAFVKLSNVCDLTEELLFKLLVLTGNLNSSFPEIIEAAGQDAKDRKIAKINTLTASDIFDGIMERGTSSIVVSNRTSILRQRFAFKRYLDLSGPLRSYRNIIVHSWHSFQIDYSVPRMNYVKSYRDWARVTDIIRSNDNQAKQKMLTEHFVPMRVFIQEEVDQLIEAVNVLWSEIIPLIPEYTHASLATINLQGLVAHNAISHAAASGVIVSKDFLTAPSIDITKANIQRTEPE